MGARARKIIAGIYRQDLASHPAPRTYPRVAHSSELITSGVRVSTALARGLCSRREPGRALGSLPPREPVPALGRGRAGPCTLVPSGQRRPLTHGFPPGTATRSVASWRWWLSLQCQQKHVTHSVHS